MTCGELSDAIKYLSLVSVFCEEPPLYADVCFIVDNHRFHCHKVREFSCIQITAQARSRGPLSSSPFLSRESTRQLKKSTTATATATSLNERFNEQNDSCARAL